MNTPIIEVRNLSKTFVLHQQGGVAIEALSGISFSVDAGECVALHGPSGAGKSTLLRALYGNYLPTGGSIRVRCGGEDVDITSADPRTVIRLRRGCISYVSQFLRVIPRVSTLDLVAEPLLEAGEGQAAARSRAEGLLARLNLPERLWHIAPATFSGGEQQRIAIARVMLKNAPIIILDEATAFADPDNESRVQAAFSRLSEGKTVIMIAHRLSTVTNVDQIFVICDGRVAECGNSRELLAKDGIFSRMWKNYQTSVQWKVTKEVQ